MTAPGGRRLRPVAALCGLLMLLWGLAAMASLVIQIKDLNKANWFDENSPGEYVAWSWLFLSAAAGGAWTTIWGVFGLGFRPPLHFGAMAVLFAVVFELIGMSVQSGYYAKLQPGWGFGDELKTYLDAFTFQVDAPPRAGSDLRLFLRAAPFVTGPFVLLSWMFVLVSGAGRKVGYAQPYQQPYPQPYQQPYPQQYPQQYAPAPYAYPQPYQQPYPQPYQQPYQQAPPAPPQAYPQPYQQPYPQPAYQAPPHQPPPGPPAAPTLRYPVASPDEQPTIEIPPER